MSEDSSLELLARGHLPSKYRRPPAKKGRRRTVLYCCNSMKSAVTAPRTGAIAPKNSVLEEFFSELPKVNITATVLSPSVKSWHMTAIAIVIPT